MMLLVKHVRKLRLEVCDINVFVVLATLYARYKFSVSFLMYNTVHFIQDRLASGFTIVFSTKQTC